MQFIFNHLSSLKLGRQTSGVRCFFYASALLSSCLFCDFANGQGRPIRQPHNFGDTPSPTEMMARLKYHKQQETPLFDLLREAGVDIFSKLSDDEKKLAGRFVEDMILKEGMNSEKVSSLMEKMNIGDEARRALQEGIARAGGGETTISPEQRKEIADKIREDFLQRSGSESDIVDSPTNQNSTLPAGPRDAAAGRDREAENKRREELGLPRLRDGYSTNRSVPNGSDTDPNRESDLVSRADPSRPNSQAREQNSRVAPNQARPSQGDRRTAENNPSRDAKNQLDQSDKPNQSDFVRAARDPATNPPNRPRRNERGSSQPSRLSQDNKPSRIKPPANSLQNRPARQAINQLESQLNASQRQIVSELKNRIQRGDMSREEIGKLLSDLQKPQPSPQGFAQQLDDVGEKFGLPPESRDEIQETFNELSPTERSTLQNAFRNVDQDLLDQLANNRGQNGRATSSSPNSESQPPFHQNTTDLSEWVTRETDNERIEQLGKDFLKDALETYNNADSGYELSPAFKQLKDRAEGKVSNREMANLGDISKKLFEGSADIFSQDSAAAPRRPDGVKPGQRLDQLLTAAAGEALKGDNTPDGENKSVFSDALNNALGVALDQAVTMADKNSENRNRDVANGWNPSSRMPLDQLNVPDQFNPLTEFNNTTNSSPSSSDSSSSSSSSSSNNSSLDDAAATIADTVTQMKFDGRYLLYVLLLIALISAAVFLLFRLIPTTDKNVLKQRELQRKLQSNSAKPKDVVEAVDLFLLSKFGETSSWWNATHAADQITTTQPSWQEKVASLFHVYRWSRYQADGNASVSSEQNELVKSTLLELSRATENFTDAAVPSANSGTDPSLEANDEAVF